MVIWDIRIIHAAGEYLQKFPRVGWPTPLEALFALNISCFSKPELQVLYFPSKIQFSKKF